MYRLLLVVVGINVIVDTIEVLVVLLIVINDDIVTAVLL